MSINQRRLVTLKLFPSSVLFFSFVGLPLSWSPPPTAQAQDTTGPETLHGVKISDSDIVFRVRSGGCTKRADFGLVTTSRKPLKVTLIRIRPDRCKAHMPQGLPMRYTFAELGAGQLPASSRRQIVIQNASDAPPTFMDDLNEQEPTFRQAAAKSRAALAGH